MLEHAAGRAWPNYDYLSLPGRKPRIQKLSVTAGSIHHRREASWSRLSPSSPCLFQTKVFHDPRNQQMTIDWLDVLKLFMIFCSRHMCSICNYVSIIPYIICVARHGGLHKRLGAFYESSRHGLQTLHPSVIHMWIAGWVQWSKDSRYGLFHSLLCDPPTRHAIEGQECWAGEQPHTGHNRAASPTPLPSPIEIY